MSLREENTASKISGSFRRLVVNEDDGLNRDGTFDSMSLGRRGMADTVGSPGTLFKGLRGTNDTYREYRRRFRGKCLICSLDEHASSVCPYQVEVPKNAIVGSGCDVVCRVFYREFSGRCCNRDSGRAKLKNCDFCYSVCSLVNTGHFSAHTSMSIQGFPSVSVLVLG